MRAVGDVSVYGQWVAVCLTSVLEVVVERGDIRGSMKDTLSVKKA